MKQQRRHELQTNVLADYLGNWIQTVQPYSKAITIGIIAVLVVAIGYVYLSGQQQAQAGASWADYFKAVGNRDAKQLDDVAQDRNGTLAGLWARQAAADLRLAAGSGLLFADRKEAQKALREAEERYHAIEKEGSRYPLLVQRARFGLAQVYEGFSEVGKAKDCYLKVAQTEPNSALAKAAAHRAEQLSDRSVEDWYNWFDRQQPVARRTAPPGKEEPKVSDDIETLPEKPDLKLPSEEASKESDGGPAGKAESQEKPQASPPAAESSPKKDETSPPAAKSGETTPAAAPETKPAATPATPEKPAKPE